MKKGYIYVLSNAAMPGYYKVGRSTHGGNFRAKNIYQTGVPEPFQLEFDALFSNCVVAEKKIHERLQAYRKNQFRKFFECDLQTIVSHILSELANDFEHEVIPADMVCAVDACYKLADLIGEHPFIVAFAFKFLDREAVMAALKKYRLWASSSKRGSI